MIPGKHYNLKCFKKLMLLETKLKIYNISFKFANFRILASEDKKLALILELEESSIT